MLVLEKLYSKEQFYNADNQHVLSHWQESLELIYIIDGSMKCMIQGNTYNLEKGALCFINSRNIHRIYCDREDCKFSSLFIEPQLLTGNKEIFDKYIEPIMADVNFTHVISSTNKEIITKEIVNLMENIGDLEKLKPVAYELSVIGILHMILQRLYLLYEKSFVSNSFDLDTDVLIYRNMADFIYKNYHKNISLDEIAKVGNISRNKCCSLFKKYADNSPINFLNLYRLEMSTKLLENTKDSVISIAISCGFDQASYFNRLFLKEYNMTPTKYRKKVQS